ncbi:MAG: class I SAM-dependent methyltransferase [Nanoarchaeota archaeon]|nr:class I SAM-dependent methyltransferase [Nanoarchaeota archaeon]
MRKPTNWDEYDSNPTSLLSKYFFFNFVTLAYSRLLKDVKFKEPIKILEFGCGTGYLDLFLAKKFNVKKITAIELNKKMVEITRKTLAPLDCEKEIVNKDFFKFKTNEQYNLVHSQGVIEHFDSKKRLELLKKHYDSTKKGGYCIVYFPTPSIAYRFFRKIAEIIGTWKFHDEVPIKKEIIIQEMNSLGFKAIKVNYFWRWFLTEVGIIFKKD